MVDWDTVRLSQAYQDTENLEKVYGATRVFKNVQDGEFTIPYSYLNQMMTERLVFGGHISDKEFLRIKGLYPDNPSSTLYINASIYPLLEN